MLCAAALMVAMSAWAETETKKFRILISANETKGETSEKLTYAWSLDGQWHQVGERIGLETTLDSDYSRSDDTEVDRLRTAFRFISPEYGKQLHKWYPIFLAQTEGDHDFDSVHTLLAFGYRQKQRHGYLEFSAGASKDIRTGESWLGDVGMAFQYERKISERLTVSTGPKAEYGAVGEVRLRKDRLRYSWDVNIDYELGERIGLGYRLWYGNTVPNSRRTQWLGVTYEMK
jgi:hypothetical protein